MQLGEWDVGVPSKAGEGTLVERAERSQAERRSKYVVGLWLRVVAGGVLLIFLSLFTFAGIAFPLKDAYVAHLGLMVLIAVNVIYWVAGSWRNYPLSDFYIHWLIDIVLISAIVLGLGGPSALSASITGYILIVVTSAVFISRKASYLVATGTAIAFIGSFVAETSGLVRFGEAGIKATESEGFQLFVIGGSVVMVYLIAHIAGTVGNQVNSINAQLAESNEVLAGKNIELDRLQKELEFHANVLTHDIRGPMSAAVVAIDEARKGMLDGSGTAEVARLLALATENIERVHDMIDALQEVREGELVDAELVEIDIGAVWKRLMIECSREIQQKGVVIELEDGMPVVIGMRDKLATALRNLVMNAVRYVPGDNGGIIRIGVREGEDEWRVFVEDNGPGVPPAFREVIFEMFRKAPQDRQSKGLGVGLALVRRVAEQHGGRAWAEASESGGAVFWVSIRKGLLFESRKTPGKT